MDFLTLGFLLLIVCVSGFIAWAADGLGRKIGKSRLRYRNIRPKHVATIGVVTTGVAVSLLTIVLVGLASSDVRQWILYGRRALAELNETRSQIRKLAAEGETLGKSNSSLRANNATLDRQRKELVRQATQLREQIQTQRRAIEEQTRQVARLTRSVRDSQRQVSNLVARQRQNAAALADASADLRKVTADVRTARAARAAAIRDRSTAVNDKNAVDLQNLKLVGEVNRLEKLQAQLDREVKALQSESTELERQRQAVADDLRTTTARLSDASARLVNLNTELAAVQADYRLAVQYNQLIGSTFASARKEPMTFKIGEELVRMPVSPGLSDDEARRTLETFESMARTSATARGARKNGPYDAAAIVDHQDIVSQRTITADDIRKSLLRQITNSDRDQVLIAYSSLNAFRGEPVSMEVGVYANPIIFRSGAVIAEGRIDGDKDETAIYQQLETFLSDRVASRVTREPLIPRSGSARPYGEVSTEEVLDVVSRIRKLDRTVFIRAMADGDTRAADLVRVKFLLR
ncbi:MAG: DUF3084 domain-containing protein [Fimbriimonadaceae bacterium]|nr:DUF3084 domain-containing protein [Fimbriimonadaceae bacterium]